MPSNKNKEMLESVAAELKDSAGMYVIDYRGLSVRDTQELRRSLREANAQMKVYKNNIVKLALADAKMPALDDILEGTCAFVFYQGDPVESAKVIKNTAAAHDTVSFKGGLTPEAALDAQQVLAIADLPSREELLAKLVGSLSSPLQGVVRVCNGPMQGLATALTQVAKQKDAA